MHVDLNHTLYHLELNAVEKSDGHCKKKVGSFKECYFQATQCEKTVQRSLVINNIVRMGVIVQTYKMIQEVREVYDGNILNNSVPMLGDLILIKKTGNMNTNMDCCCYHWTVMY